MDRQIIQKLMRKKILFSALFFTTVFFSCKKEGALTPDFEEGSLNINFTDTITINTKVELEEPIRTDLSNLNLLGIYNDPIFGPTASSIYTQVLLTGLNVDFGPNPILDSIVLTLDYEDIYGNLESPMTVDVFELTTALDPSVDYFSNQSIPHDPSGVGSLTFVPDLLNNVIIAFDNAVRDPHVRIKLNDDLGQRILNAGASGSNNLSDNNAFTDFFKGLYITTRDSVTNTSLPTEEGSIAYFDMNSLLSTLTIYYNDSLFYDFTINTDAVKFSRFDHNYVGTDIDAHLSNSLTRDSTVTYVSTLAGVRTRLELPNIEDLANQGINFINKAELVLTVEPGTSTEIDPEIPSMSLVGIAEDGNTFFLPDFFEGQNFGGTFNEEEGTYTFNISRQISNLINSVSPNLGMYIVANGASVSANRTVMSSENNSISRIMLNITYSKL